MSEHEQVTDDGWEDWDHILPDDEWADVVAEAERIYQQRLAEESSYRQGDRRPPGLTPKRISFKDTHSKNSGSVTRRQLFVIHTAESPLKVGYAESLTKWGNGGYQPRASWQKFVDPATVVSWIPLSKAAWHAAPANRLSVGYEQSGYAKYSRDQWLSSDGLRQIDLLAQEIVKDGIPASGLRWLTDAQVKAVLQGNTKTYGLCTHAQVVKAGKQLGKSLAGRTDPGAGYPKDVLLDWVKHYHSGGTLPPPPPEEATMITAVLRRDASGSQVRLLQTMLNGLRGAKLEVDGKFGPATEKAVVAAHKAWGVGTPHNVVGPGFRARINREWEKHNAPKTTVVAQQTTPAEPALTIANIKSAVREVLKEEGLIK